MKFALINPPWRFEDSIYFGCHELMPGARPTAAFGMELGQCAL